MAALINSELPAGFTTLEQLSMYVGITMSVVYPDNFVIVTNTSSEKVADTGIIRTADGRDFFISRCMIPLDPEYTTPINPLWTYANENANIAIPARFKA